MPVLAVDLDGTICFGGGAIGPDILAVLEARPAGVEIVLASARHPVNVLQAAPPALLADWDVVGANGALALRRDSPVFEARLDPDAAARMLDVLDGMRCAYLAYGANFVLPGRHPHAINRVVRRDIGRALRLGTRDDVAALVKILVLPPPGDTAVAGVCIRDGAFCVMTHSDGTLDLTAWNVDKTSGIEALGHDLPVDAAFGNDANDIAMLKMARFSVAVGDHPALTLVADRIVPSGPDHEERIASALGNAMTDLSDERRAVRV